MFSKSYLLSLFIILGVIFSCTGNYESPSKDLLSINEDQNVIFRAPSSYVSRFLKNDSLNFDSINHHSFRLYFKRGSFSEKNIPHLKNELTVAYKRVFEVLDTTDYKYGTYILLVDSEEEMEELMGYHIKGGAAKGHDLLFIVNSDSVRPQFKHEFFHLASYETWGLTESRLLDEGAATYADNECYYPNPMYTINAHFDRKNQLFPISDLVNDFDNTASQNDIIAYLQSAGYFQFLYETYGVIKMKELWTKGFNSFDSIYPVSLEELDTQFRELLSFITIPEDFNEELILSNGCG